jgi:hypothetical protein
MKKLVFIVGLLALFLTLVKQVEAVCSKSLSSLCPINKLVNCVPGLTAICCETDTACTAYKKNAVIPQQKEDAAARMVELCEYAGDNKGACELCFKKDPAEAWTAIGCIPTSPSGFIEKFLSTGVGIAGGIAFLLILFAGFQMMTSAGNPEKLNAGKELMTSAISGLVLIVFSIFLLRLIGVTILQLPEFE